MRRVVAIVVAIVIVAFAGLLAYTASQSQHADNSWSPRVERPTYVSSHPRVVVDQAHYNAHTTRGKYRPFARLLEADGCVVEGGKKKFAPADLEGVEVLVIVNASGGPKPNLFGLNLPIPTRKKREMPAFSAPEIEAVRAWVEAGGSLLLIADHAPFGESCAAMAAAFGVRMNQGFVETPGDSSDPMPFSRENGRLGEHAILSGAGSETKVGRLFTFTGQSLDGPPEATVLLRLPETAVEYVPRREPGGTQMVEQKAGAAQGLAFERGAGRVVVLGEAAMLTAQVVRNEKFGLGTPGCDNRQFALNIVHWLTHEF